MLKETFMEKIKRNKIIFIAISLTTMMISAVSAAGLEGGTAKSEIEPMVVQKFFEEAKKNKNWKTAFATGKDEQIVLMNISPLTNPSNEIGDEVHPFDQVIIIVEGSAKALLNGKTSLVNEGGMIFIPKGTSHNVVNLDREKALKLVSFYSKTDIPQGAVYQKKSDQPKD